MAKKKLMFSTGIVEDPTVGEALAAASMAALPEMAPNVSPMPIARLVKTVIMVHNGEHGEDLTLAGAIGDVEMTDERVERIVQNQNAMLDRDLTSHYESFDLIPIGAFPPVLDAHEDEGSVMKIIGRMTSKLRFERRDLPKVGKNCACAVGEVTFLGADTVERVLDGRMYHLSIGINEETDTLGEVSAVINPAAKGAMILSQRKSKGASMPTKLKAKTDRIAKLKAAQTALTGLTNKMVAVREKTTLAAAHAGVTKRLSAAMRGGKITRADIKGMDVKKLAALPASAIDVLMDTIEGLEPRITPGQIGTSQAIEFAQMGKQLEKKQKNQLKSEIRGDLKKLGAKLKDQSETEKKLNAMVDAVDNVDESKLSSDDDSDEKQTNVPVVDQGDTDAMGNMQKQVDELNTQIARVAGIVSDLLEDSQSEEADDGDDMDLAAEEPEENKMGEDPEKKDDEKLSDGDDKEDDKKKDLVEDPDKKELADDDDKDEDKKKFKKK